MQSLSLTTSQPHTVPPRREVTAPSDCTSFTAEQEAALDALATKAIAATGTLAESTLWGIYNETRKQFQHVNMIRSLRGKS